MTHADAADQVPVVQSPGSNRARPGQAVAVQAKGGGLTCLRPRQPPPHNQPSRHFRASQPLLHEILQVEIHAQLWADLWGRYLDVRKLEREGKRQIEGVNEIAAELSRALAMLLLPPSRHASGRRYSDDPDHALFETPLAAAPPWMLDFRLHPSDHYRPRANGNGEHSALAVPGDPYPKVCYVCLSDTEDPRGSKGASEAAAAPAALTTCVDSSLRRGRDEKR